VGLGVGLDGSGKPLPYQGVSPVLLAFQFQVMKCTGNSGSNPEWAHGDTFLLAVNDLTTR
jgi:hypothetical protein